MYNLTKAEILQVLTPGITFAMSVMNTPGSPSTALNVMLIDHKNS
jgi:hypothetical protein